MKYFFASLLLITFSTFLSAQNAEDVVGEWLPSKGKAHIKISKYGDYFSGRIVWLEEPNDEKTGKPKVDQHNPDPKRKNTPIQGLLLMQGFKYDDGAWTGGTIYDAESGKTYNCTLKLKNKNTLEVRGYIGISLIGRTDVWTRFK
jgi:uncharacterized protein (DUF2147 family)